MVAAIIRSMTEPILTSWQHKSVTILGLSKSGCAVARYIQRRGGHCFISETLPATPDNEGIRNELSALGVQIEMGGHTQQCFTHSDLVVVSPGIPPSASILSELRLSGKTIISEVELAYQETQVPIIGITGTNGKTTTTTLISEILETAKLNAPACGNIGTPLLTVLDDAVAANRPLDYLVAELSSFQLEMSPTLTAKVAVLTNLTPDHLDWHGSLQAYEAAKLSLFTSKQSPEWAVLDACCASSQKIAHHTTSKILWFAKDEAQVSHYENRAFVDASGNVVVCFEGQPPLTLFSVRALQIIGSHNHLNVLSAVSVALILGISPALITQACLSFKGVEHRLERVESVQGVDFYNDSKATNPEASISALRAFESRPVILIAGGRDKMGPLEDFAAEVKQHAAHVVLLGEAKERFSTALRASGVENITFANSLEEAIQLAAKHSSGEPILFSPACASFDMFKNYEERGRAFKTLVTQFNNAFAQASR